MKLSLILSALVLANIAEAKPQKLPVENYTVCGISLKLEVAKTRDQQAIGMGGRTVVPSGTGMLFHFENEEPRSFWMKDVSIDLDIGFFDKTGTLFQFETMKGASPLVKDAALPNYNSDKAAKFVVEAAPGFFAKAMKSSKGCKLEPLPKN